MQTGTEIYYTGDMANQEGFFKVTHISNTFTVTVSEIDGDRSFSLYPSQIASKYEGHCGERFVTRDAYNAYREELMARYS